MNLKDIEKKLLTFSVGKLETLSIELDREFRNIKKRINKVDNEINSLQNKIEEKNSLAVETVNEKLGTINKPTDLGPIILVITVVILISFNIYFEIPKGLNTIIFFALVAPLALLIGKILSPKEEYDKKEYKNYQRRYDSRLNNEKKKLKVLNLEKKIKNNKKLLDQLEKKEDQIISIQYKIPKTIRRSKERERTAKIVAFDKKAREGAKIVRKDLLRSTTKLNWKCPYCLEKKSIEKSEADHIHPINKGGLSTIQNMILICKPCNSKKKGTTLRVFCKKYNYNFDEICERLEKQGKDV